MLILKRRSHCRPWGPISPHRAGLPRATAVCAATLRLRRRKVVAESRPWVHFVVLNNTRLVSSRRFWVVGRCWGAQYTLSVPKKGSAPQLAADNGAEPSPFQRAKHNYWRTYSANMQTDEIALFLILRNHTPLCTLHGRDSTTVSL